MAESYLLEVLICGFLPGNCGYVRAAFYPVLSAEAGLLVDYEVLP
jgi:hypothetical protein